MKNMHAQIYRGSSFISAILRSFRAAGQTSILFLSVKKIKKKSLKDLFRPKNSENRACVQKSLQTNACDVDL